MDPQSLNRYAYVLNNPTNLIDPLGLEECMVGGDGQEYCYDFTIGTTVWARGGLGFYEILGIVQNPFVSMYGHGIFTFWDPPPVPPPDRQAEPPEDTDGAGSGSWLSKFGVRAENQTFGQCMEQNASNYSIAGLVDFAWRADGQISNSFVGGALGGNQITGTYFALFGTSEQSARNAFSTGAASTGNIASTAMGSPLTHSRRTASVMALNLAGKRGGPPLALSFAARRAKNLIGKLSGGVIKLAFDIGFTLAEGVGCSIAQ